MKKRLLSIVLTLAMVLTLLPSTVLAVNDTSETATVSVTLSNDGAIVLGNDTAETRLSGIQVTVPYFDLALYDYQDFYRYEADSFEDGGAYISDTVVEQPTVLHLYIYMLERYYYGIPAEDCGKGREFLQSTYGINFGDAAEASAVDELGNEIGSADGLSISGSATSLYMTNFWGHDENLMYYVNHTYPLMAQGWGATSDYILLEDGDTIDLAMFSNWDFWSNGYFGYMQPENSSIKAGDTVDFSAFGVGTSAGLDGNTPEAVDLDVAWSVQNSAGEEIASSDVASNTFSYTFDTAGEYTVIGYDPNKGTEDAAIAPAVGHVSVINPLMGALKFAGSSSASAAAYTLTPEFDESITSYELTVPDSANGVYAWAALADGASGTISADYTQTTGASKKVSITSGKASGQWLSSSLATGGAGNTITVNAAVGDTTQAYTIKINRSRSLSSLSVSDSKGDNLILDKSFAEAELEYSAVTADDTVTIDAGLRNSDYVLTVNGSDSTTAALQDGDNKIEVTVAYPADNTSTTYTLNIKKVEPALVSFAVTPADAVIQLNDAAGTRLWQNADGAYSLLPGASYSYTVTKNGYVGQHDSFTASETETIELALTKAEKNDAIDKTIEAQWANFRNGDNNLGITNAATPYNSEDAELPWAVKYGTGWSAAPGSPILVDDCLVTYVGSTIKKLNMNTGEVVQTADMVGASSFSIVPPTYADGMIFVGLSNGRIQAFNAATLESLWVYTDSLGGQPNCPITYKDGFVYAGFWGSETKNANFVCLSATDEDPTQTTEAKTASWTYTRAGGFYWAGAYANSKYVVVGTDDGQSGYSTEGASLLVFDRTNGKQIDSVDGIRGDIRSNVSYDPESDRVFFTSKGGVLCNAKINWETGEIAEFNQSVIVNAAGTEYAMSTCTPSVYNGRIYIGVAGNGQFSSDSGHCIAVYDLNEDGSMTQAYAYAIMGYPQTSAMVSTAYEEDTGYVYIYLPYNYTPGGISVLKDKAGQTEPLTTSDTGYSEVFTPTAPLTQYALCSTIADENGTIYYKNDSCYMMAITSKIASIEVTNNPNKLRYNDEEFDAKGMTVVANMANGKQRDITNEVTWSQDALNAEDTSITLSYTYGFDNANYGLKTKTVELPINMASVSASVDITAQAMNSFLTAPSTETVSSVLADDYGYMDSVPYDENVSALDVLVRAHELTFGDAFSAETANDYLTINENGFVTKLFGEETGNCGFTINNLTPTTDEETGYGGYVSLSVNAATVTDNDKVDFFLYQDEYAMDYDTWFMQNGTASTSLTAEAKIPMDLTVQGYYVGWYGYYYRNLSDIVSGSHAADVADAQLAIVNMETGEITDINGAVTDENGAVSLTFDKAGTYVITAYVPDEAIADYATPAIMRLATVTVAEHTNHNWTDEVTVPTCTEQGFTTHTCTYCGETAVDTYVDALGHDTVLQNAKAATYVETGYTGDTYCNRCKKTIETGTVIPVLDKTAEMLAAEESIHAIGTVTLNSKTAIDSARAAYDALTDEQKQLISNYDTLTAAEAEYNKLYNNIPYGDIPAGEYYVEPVKWAIANGITNGISETEFAPNTDCTRAHVVTFLWRAAGSPEPTSAVSPFHDVQDSTAWYYKAVLWAVENGVTTGTSNETFTPDGACTRAQVVTLLWRQAGEPTSTAANPFTDIVTDSYYYQAVLWAVENGITAGTTATTFAPADTCTRAQIVTFLYRDLA